MVQVFKFAKTCHDRFGVNRGAVLNHCLPKCLNKAKCFIAICK